MSNAKKSKPARLGQRDYEALADLRYALRRFLAFSGTAAHGVGLPPQQHQALLAIKGSRKGQRVTVGFLAERLLITAHAATELVDRLAEARLVVRRKDPQDGRRLILSLTAGAEKILRSLSVEHLKEIRELAPSLVEILKDLEQPSGRRH